MKVQHGTRVSFRTTAAYVQVLEQTAKALGAQTKRGTNVSAAIHHILDEWAKKGLKKLKRAS